MKNILLVCFAAGVCLAAESGSGYKVITKYPVGGNGGWDYVTLDAQARRLYLSHATQVDVLDADTGKSVGVIADTPGVHGIAIAGPFNHGFTTNGREDKVSMFDPKTLALIKKVPVGKGPDGVYYDAASKRVFTCNHGSHDISVLDAKSGDVVGTVAVAGDGEQIVTGADGMLYVNLEDTAEVAVFDPKTLEIKHKFPITGGKTPTGLAYDKKNNRLFIGCRSKVMVVMNAADGKVIGSFPIGTGVDWAEFDPDAKLVFISNGDGTLNVFRQKSADVYEDAGTVNTQNSAKTMAFDHKTKKIFLPAADVEMVIAPDTKKQTRKIKPDSFVVVVVGK
jgi:YVTN family beta-propeller protein